MITSRNERLAATGAHAAGILLSATFLGWVIPLVMYFANKEKSKFVAFHSMQAVLYQLVIAVVGLIAGIAVFITFGILWFLPIAVGMIGLLFGIVAAVQAFKGKTFMLPIAGDYARKIVRM
ncbi:MAG: DUF4870 domain-containing protein [Armatimonadetes bacterium]|nr:DUF4870 domain-containing protein [Armatimonadota bacterium]